MPARVRHPEKPRMKSDQQISEILAAYDATESISAAAKMAACDPKTVRRYVEARHDGRPPARALARSRMTGPYLAKIAEWVDRSEGLIGAHRVHARLVEMGFTGSDRTTRRAVAEAKARWSGRDRRGAPRPWSTEPGLWLQFGWAPGPSVPDTYGDRRPTVLFCAWLPWSRYRIVVPHRNRSLRALISCLDTALRTVDGVPTYLLARIRSHDVEWQHRVLHTVGRHYGAQVRPCVPYDPRLRDTASAGVPIADRDWLPTSADLPSHVMSFAALRSACTEFAARANAANSHRGAQGTPYERLMVERSRLHPVPPGPPPVPAG